jgi:ubiquinone/menaquinone biosynthesis C-methylase UbiE
MSGVKDTVAAQFGSVADAYLRSEVHATGADLDRILSLASIPGANVLDVGCGAGHVAVGLSQRVGTVTAVDITPAMLATAERLAHERGCSNIHFKNADVENLPFGDAEFDVAVSRYSAHHWPNPETALAEIRRVLRRHGRFVLGDIVSPARPAADTWLQSIELLRDTSHVRDHREQEWLTMLEDAGFAAQVNLRFVVAIDFESWVQRMATPPEQVRILHSLLSRAPSEVRAALQIDDQSNFALSGVVIEAVRQ